MDLVIDANSLFAALIKNGKSAEILLNVSCNFFTPEFILSEFEKHKVDIMTRTHRDLNDFMAVFNRIMEIVKVVPKEEIESFLDEADRISPDPDDVMYFALALKLKCGIWSNDGKLKEPDMVKVYSTEDLIRKFEL